MDIALHYTQQMEEDKFVSDNLIFAIKELINRYQPATQHEIIEILVDKYSFVPTEVSQSKISRILRQVGAVKRKIPGDKVVYAIDQEQMIPSKKSSISDFILSVEHNNHTIVVKTVPGAAPIVARTIDFDPVLATEVLGSISGDDCIFIAPRKNVQLDELAQKIVDEI